MLSFASSLASQIGYLIANLNKNNYKSVVFELSQLTEYGLDGSVILLRICLEQAHLREPEVQNLQLKVELLACVLRKLVHQPNFSTIFCEAVRQILSQGDDHFLESLSQSLNLSLPEQIRIGLALLDAEDLKHRQEGQIFVEQKVVELYHNGVSFGAGAGAEAEALISDILRLLRLNEGLSRHTLPLVTALPSVFPDVESSLLLTPWVSGEVDEVNCRRKFNNFSASGLPPQENMVLQLSTANNVADVMEELGYGCTSDVEHCKEIFSLFPAVSEKDVAGLVGMIARTHKGLEDSHGTHGTFSTALCSGEHLSSDYLTTWNVDVVLETLKQLAPDLNWVTVMENMDQEGFYLPDQKAFSAFMSIYKRSCQDVFPIQAICGAVWKNGEGQLSFLRHAVSAPPDVFTFTHSPRKQSPLEGLPGQRLPYGTPNLAWLSLDLLEVLCLLAETGHASGVRSLLEYPLKHCPELLLLGMAQIKTDWPAIQSEIFSAILPAIFNSTTHTAVLRQLWSLDREIVIKVMVDLHLKEPGCLSRLSEVCQELEVLEDVLNTSPFSFAIDLAALSSRRDGSLNLEQWLQDTITIHRDTFFQACLNFLRERRLSETRSDGLNGSASAGQRAAPINSLSLDTTAVIFKVLQANVGQLSSRDLVDELKRVYQAAVRLNPRLLSVGASEQSSSEVFAADIEEEANSYFQKIYVGQLSITDVVGMLERFNESSVQREQEIFACMIQSLFDEYRFFPRYPERELKITAVLFGSLIKHQLVSSLTLGIALRCVLDALRKPLDSKMFSFGNIALQEFTERLVEWPQYCNHILQISHMREGHTTLVSFIERALERVTSSQAEPTGIVPPSVEQPHVTGGQVFNLGNSVTPEPPEVSGTVVPEIVDQRGSEHVASQPRLVTEGSEGAQQASTGSAQQLRERLHQMQPPPSQQFLQQQQALEERHTTTGASLNYGSRGPQLAPSVTAQSATSQSSTYQSSSNGQLATGSSNVGNMLRQPRSGLTSALRQPSLAAAFGHAINIETLVAAAERKDIQHEAPNSEVQDKVAFIINNISIANLEPKAKEFLEAVQEQYYPWFAQYMVMKRASIEPNFHDTYLKFLDKINSKLLHKEVVKATYENCKVLLRSELIKSSSEERSLLKNLGSWLGKLTIGRNQALRAKEIDPKSLITEAYEKGLMIAVIPFTSKILEPCQSSLAYQPPNPWTMGILGLLAEIYSLPNLKMNLKFDIEVLYKNLGVDMKDVKPTQLLKGRVRDVESNPDFSNKDYAIQHPPQPVAVSEPQSTLSAAAAPVAQPAPSGHLSGPSVQQDEERVGSLALTGRAVPGQGLSSSTPSPSPYSVGQVSMSIPNLQDYVVVNPKLAGLGLQVQLQRIVPVAMERAIREIISPVVDRSVTIACMTTRELVLKDYSMEAEADRTHQSANLMVASLSGSLAHVTCKEPLRVAMANHLRSLLSTINIGGDVLEQSVQLVTNDNLDLGCAVIEKAATEKALRDLEDAIGPALTVRRNQIKSGASLIDATTYCAGNLGRLPEALRPKPGRLSSSQQRVYEDFARLPWQNQSSQGPVAPAGPATPPGVSLGPGAGSGPYSVSSRQMPGTGSTFSSTGGASAGGLGSLTQPDVALDEVDHTTSSMSFTSVGSGVGPDGLQRASPDGSLGLNYSGVGSPTDGAILEGATAAKGASAANVASSPPAATEQLGIIPAIEPSLTNSEAIEKYQVVVQKVDAAISKVPYSSYSSLPPDHEIRNLVMEIPEIITQCVSRDEAALGIAQKEFKRLYDNTSNHLHLSAHLTILEAIRDVCKRVVKELTSWVVYSDEDRKLNREIIVGLIRSDLIYLTNYNLHLAKLMDGGRNSAALDFAIYLVKTCVVEGGVSNNEFQNVIDVLGKLAGRPGSPEALQQLVEVAKNASASPAAQGSSTSKEDKGRLSKEKKIPTSRMVGGARDDTKTTSRDGASADPPGLHEKVAGLFEDWIQICDGPAGNDKAYAVYMSQLQHSGMLKGDDISDRFFRILMELAVAHAEGNQGVLGQLGQPGQSVSFAAIDMYAKLVVLLVKYYAVDPAMSKVALLNKVLNVTVKVIQRDADEKKTTFNPRPYFRLIVTWLMDFNSADPALDSSNFQVLTAFGNALLTLQPLRVPGWSFAWLELISHRIFMPKLLLSNAQKGWPLFQRLLVALFKFMEPYLRNADLSDPVRLLYKGTLRVLLVLLHDFPEFLCDHHFSFCDVIPPSCIQMRNLILSAFPRNMRLPDPFTPNLKVDLLPEISQAPRILSDVEAALKNKQLKAEIDDYLKTRQPLSLLSVDLKQRLMLPQHEAVPSGTRYNVPLINALVLYVGMQAIQQLQSKTTPQQLAVPTAPITHSAPMDIFQMLIVELDTEGRYLFLNAVANQLRYPNNHTHYFSCVLLYLFAEANQEIIQEQITRVLLERLIVNRPHPWGLLITFIELIKNPRYNFWSHGFTRCAPEIEKLFESVARSCMGPPLKPSEDDLPSGLAAEGIKV